MFLFITKNGVSNYLRQQIEREGTDVTITAFSKMVGFALKVSLDG